MCVCFCMYVCLYIYMYVYVCLYLDTCKVPVKNLARSYITKEVHCDTLMMKCIGSQPLSVDFCH